jgi:uncharacterized protein
LRGFIWENANLVSKLTEGKENDDAKFKDYFNYSEPVMKIPSLRALAVFRRRKEDILKVTLVIGDPDTPVRLHPCEVRIATIFGFLIRAGLQINVCWALLVGHGGSCWPAPNHRPRSRI